MTQIVEGSLWVGRLSNTRNSRVKVVKVYPNDVIAYMRLSNGGHVTATTYKCGSGLFRHRFEPESSVAAKRAVTDDLAAALRALLKAYESVLPGIRYIAVQDYALVNDAPVAAERALKAYEEQT